MGKGNLLIIDDEKMILSSIKELLEDVAENIYIADNGADGIKIIEQHDIHAIICDINMPQMSGVEVIKKIRSKNIETPFIFYTGFGSRDLMMEAVKYGAFDFIEKPNMLDLEAIVTRALKVGQHEDPKTPEDSKKLISEYQKMIQDLKL